MTRAEKDHFNQLYNKYYKGKVKRSSIPGESRKDLMEKARKIGVKNFRVLNKEELQEATNENTTPERRLEVINQAVARWKAGWGKREKRCLPMS